MWKRRRQVLSSILTTLLAISANDASTLCAVGEPVRSEATKQLRPTQLRCEYATNPLGIDAVAPQLSWILESSEHDQAQSAYRVMVASSPTRLAADQGDVWDSGKVASRESAHVVYQGSPLKSGQRCWWKVRVWDKAGRESPWSSPATLEMGLLDRDAWNAKWIGSGPAHEPRPVAGFFKSKKELEELKQPAKVDSRSTLLRKEFVVRKPVRLARAYVTGLGYYEFSCNGKRVGDRVLAPAKTNYRNWVLYDTYDVTNELRPGPNALGMMLGNGWFNPTLKWWEPYRMQWFGSKRGLLQLHIEYTDGTTETIVTDETWKTSPGPVLSSCVYDGETYDATQESAGWNQPAFDDSNWPAANVVEPPGGILVSHAMPPIKVIEHIPPVAVKHVRPGVYVFDFGQNFAGWARLTVNAPRGTHIKLRYAEDVDASGNIDTKSNERALATDEYVTKGGGQEAYEPKFTFHGFQYVEVTGFPGTPHRDALLGCVVHSACESIGEFACDNDLINRIHAATRWAQRSNLMGYPMDCPQRDERLGWFGDAMVSMDEAMFNFDMASFYRQWLDGVERNQNPSNGDISIVSPRPYMELEPDPTWSSAYVVMAWNYYQHYGDERFLARHYDSMKRYVDYLSTQAKDGILPKYWIGDWGTIVQGWQEGEPVSVTTAFYFYDANIVAKTARLLGKDDDAQYYGKLAADIRSAFNRTYFDAHTRNYEKGSQFSNAFPLLLGLVEPRQRPAVLENIVHDLHRQRDHFDVGVLGAKYLIDALTAEGRADVAFGLATQTGYPSWAHMLENGRTTLSEFWDLHGSHNHVMMGSIDGWFYRTLAGIQPSDDRPGFAHIVIKPYIPATLNFVKASTQTVQGRVAVEWRKEPGKLRMSVLIPANSTATIYMPAASHDAVQSEPPLKPLRSIRDAILYEAGSGRYELCASKGN